MSKEVKILALCDSPERASGFAKVAQNVLRRWSNRGAIIDVWGVMFTGWGYRRLSYINELFPAAAAGCAWYEPARLQLFLQKLETGGYTHCWIMQDTFLLSAGDFPARLREVCAKRGIRSMLYFPVDAPLDPSWVQIVAAVDVAVAYTEYGRKEALQKGAVLNPAPQRVEVLPHGVDTTVFRPAAGQRETLREQLWDPKWVGPDDFLMINVNAHQRRKDVGRSLEVLQEVRRRGVPAKLLMHMAESSADHDGALSLEAVATQLGLQVFKEWAHHGSYFRKGHPALGEEQVLMFYQASDLYLTTSLGEGWGLGITEALACGCGVALPMHTACEEVYKRVVVEGMGDRMVPLPVEWSGLMQEGDNSRVRHRVQVAEAATLIVDWYESGRWRERPSLNGALREWLDWDRIAGEMWKLLVTRHGEEDRGSRIEDRNHEIHEPREKEGSPSEPPGKMPGSTAGSLRTATVPAPTRQYYLELGGGLGDVFNALYQRGAYHVLRDLRPEETARVVLMSHNPFVRELFEWHPKRGQMQVVEGGYCHTTAEDLAARQLHNLPPRGTNGLLPDKRGGGPYEFHVSEAEAELLARVQGESAHLIVMAATAGLTERSLPGVIASQIASGLIAHGYLVVVTGRSFDRHGRKELRLGCALDHHGGVIDLVDQLSVPGTARLVQASAGLVTCHSALNLLAWWERRPQLLLYPEATRAAHFARKDEWSFGRDYPETVHGVFEEYSETALQAFLWQVRRAAGSRVPTGKEGRQA